MASHLQSLGSQVAERLKSAFRLGVQRTLGVASTHYDMDLVLVSSGFVVVPGVEGDAAAAAMDEADAVVEDFAPPCPRNLRTTSPFLPKTTLQKIRRGKRAICRKSGPWSPCK